MSHQIETVEDFVRILKEHPEWRERVREVLLNEEGLSLSDFANPFYEMIIDHKGTAIIGKFIRKPRKVYIPDFIERIEDQSSPLFGKELVKLYEIDMLITGLDKRSGETVYLAVEVSWMIRLIDVRRAISAAEVLQMCGYKAYPALIGVGIEPYAHKLVQREGVLTFLDGSILHYGVFSGL